MCGFDIRCVAEQEAEVKGTGNHLLITGYWTGKEHHLQSFIKSWSINLKKTKTAFKVLYFHRTSQHGFNNHNLFFTLTSALYFHEENKQNALVIYIYSVDPAQNNSKSGIFHHEKSDGLATKYFENSHFYTLDVKQCLSVRLCLFKLWAGSLGGCGRQCGATTTRQCKPVYPAQGLFTPEYKRVWGTSELCMLGDPLLRSPQPQPCPPAARLSKGGFLMVRGL